MFTLWSSIDLKYINSNKTLTIWKDNYSTIGSRVEDSPSTLLSQVGQTNWLWWDRTSNKWQKWAEERMNNWWNTRIESNWSESKLRGWMDCSRKRLRRTNNCTVLKISSWIGYLHRTQLWLSADQQPITSQLRCKGSTSFTFRKIVPSTNCRKSSRQCKAVWLSNWTKWVNN